MSVPEPVPRKSSDLTSAWRTTGSVNAFLSRSLLPAFATIDPFRLQRNPRQGSVGEDAQFTGELFGD